MSSISKALATAYSQAPASWVATYPGRVNNVVRGAVFTAADQGLALLRTEQGPDPDPDYLLAEQALVQMRRVARGTDPRGGKERDQIVFAINEVARRLAHHILIQEESA